MLQPWAPGSGDARHAAAVFDRLIHALSFLEETIPAPRFDLFDFFYFSKVTSCVLASIALIGTSSVTLGVTMPQILPTRPLRTMSSRSVNHLS